MNQRPRAEKREGRKQTVDGGDDGRRASPTAAKLCPPNRVFPPFLPLPSLFCLLLLRSASSALPEALPLDQI